MFSVNQTNTIKKEEKGFATWYKHFCSQPHQAFFTNGIIFFILFIGLLFLSFSGSIALSTTLFDYHAYPIIYVVFIQFFLGFLFITFPRFLREKAIETKVYMKHFYLYFTSSLGIFLSLLFSIESLFIFFVFILFLTHLYSFSLLLNIHKKSILTTKEDTKWILIFFVFGLFSHFLYIFSFVDSSVSYTLKQISINIGFYLFLFGIVFSVSQRMIPFFTSAKIPNYVINKTKNLLPIVCALLVLKVILLSFDNTKLNLISDVPLFIIFVRELFKWKLNLFKSVAILWVLHLALYWIPFAFLLSILESLNEIFFSSFVFEKVVVHTLALGYFLTVLIGFGTRVILGHSGQTPNADKFTVGIFIFLQVVVLLRVFTSFSTNFGFDYFFFINLTSLLLICSLLVWSSRYLRILIKGK